jgi:tyrosine-protein kinase Etk/Wzc
VTTPHADDTPSGTDRLAAPDVLAFALRHRVMLLAAPLLATLAGAAIAFVLPHYYAGVTKILPPQQNQSSAALLLAQLGSGAGIPASALGVKNPNDLYVGMLKSRTVADRLIEHFGLRPLYDQDTLDETRRVLARRTSISHGRDGIITIEFEDRDPKRAAAVANGYVQELYRLTQTLAVTEAGQRRLFLDKQLKLTKDALAEAEVALKRTQESTGLIKLDDQGRAIIDAVAKVRAQIASKEVEAGAMRSFATDVNPGYVRLQQEIAGLRQELGRLEKSNGPGGGDMFVPAGRVPEAGLEYIRRLRDVKYYETVFELLAKQFEMAKMDEARDASVVQVLDEAVPAERKSWPPRLRFVLLSALLGLLAALAVGLARDSARERRRA